MHINTNVEHQHKGRQLWKVVAENNQIAAKKIIVVKNHQIHHKCHQKMGNGQWAMKAIEITAEKQIFAQLGCCTRKKSPHQSRWKGRSWLSLFLIFYPFKCALVHENANNKEELILFSKQNHEHTHTPVMVWYGMCKNYVSVSDCATVGSKRAYNKYNTHTQQRVADR